MKRPRSYGPSTRRKGTRKYKKLGKDLYVRGGFVASGPTTPKHIFTAVGKSLGSGPEAVNKGRAFVSNMAKTKAALDVAGATIDVVAQVRALGLAGDTTAVSKTESRGVANPNSAIGRKFSTRFDVGKPSTRIVNEKARANGSRKLTQFDTTVQNQDPTSDARKTLTMTTGVNQKSVYGFNSRSHWTLGDLETLVDQSAFTRSTNQSQIAYWMTKYFGVKTRLMNTNKYLKTKVKVHWLRLNENSFAPKDWLADCVKATSLPTPTDTNQQWLPYNLQLTGAVNTTDRFGVALDVELGSMRKSKNFEIAFESVKTFSKTLEPGETWEIDYRHHTGPGLRLNDILATGNNGEWSPDATAFYYPMFEVSGTPVEVVDSNNRDSSFLATSSGAIQVEFKKYCEIVLADTSSTVLYVGTGGLSKARWDYRIFTDYSTTADDGTTITRRFNIDYSNILKASEADGVGKYIIPVSTDTQKARGGRSNDGA